MSSNLQTLGPSTFQLSSTFGYQKTTTSIRPFPPPPPLLPPHPLPASQSHMQQRKRPRNLSQLLLYRELGIEPSGSLLGKNAFGNAVMRLITPSPVILSISSPSLSDDLDERIGRDGSIVDRDSTSVRDATATSSSTSSLTFHITTLSFNEDGTILLVGDSTGRLAIFETSSFFSLDVNIHNSLQPRSQISPMVNEKDVTLSPLHSVLCPGPIYVARWHPKRIGHCAVICYGKRDIYLYDMTSVRKNPLRVIQRDSSEPIGVEATFSSGNTDFIFVTIEEGSLSGLSKSINPAIVHLITGDGLGRIYGYDTRLPPTKSNTSTLPLKLNNGHLWTIDISELYRGTNGPFTIKRLWIEKIVKANLEHNESDSNNDSTTSIISPLLLFVATIGGHVCSFDLRKLSTGSFGSSKPRPAHVSSWRALDPTSNSEMSSTLYVDSVLTDSKALPAYSVALTFEGGVTSVYDLFTGKLLDSIKPSICPLDQQLMSEEVLIEKSRLSFVRPKQYPMDRSMLTLDDSMILLPQTRSIAPLPLQGVTEGKTLREKHRYFRGTEGIRIDSRPNKDHEVLSFVQLCGESFKGQRVVIRSPGCVTSLICHPLRWDLIVLGMSDGEIVVMQAEKSM
jgi:hypothetical protein